MKNTYLATDELAERIKYDARTVQDRQYIQSIREKLLRTLSLRSCSMQ